MPITEIVLPNFKSDPQSLKELETAFPAAFSVFQGADGLYSLRLGYHVTPNGDELSPVERRPLTICEWESVGHFKAFSNTPPFGIFKERIEPYKVAPPTLELFNTPDLSSNEATQAPFTQVLRVNNTTESGRAAESKLHDLFMQSAADKQAVGYYSGKGIWNPTGQLILIGWQNLEEFHRIFVGSDAGAAIDEAVKDGNAMHFICELGPLVEQRDAIEAAAAESARPSL